MCASRTHAATIPPSLPLAQAAELLRTATAVLRVENAAGRPLGELYASDLVAACARQLPPDTPVGLLLEEDSCTALERLTAGQRRLLAGIAAGTGSLGELAGAVAALAEHSLPEARAALFALRDGQLAPLAAPTLTAAEIAALASAGSPCALAATTGRAADAPWPSPADLRSDPEQHRCHAWPVLDDEGRNQGVLALLLPCAPAGEADEVGGTLLATLSSALLGLLQLGLSQLDTRRTLEASQRQLRALVDAIPDLIFFKDAEGIYRGCNSAFSRVAGRPAEEIIGSDDAALFGAETARGYRSHDRSTMQGRHVVVEEQCVCDAAGQAVAYETIKAPVVDADGRVLGIVGVARDVQYRREAETQLRLAASVFANSHDGILIVDKDGTVRDVNRAFTTLTGFEAAAVLGKPAQPLMLPVGDPAEYAEMIAAVQTTGAWQGELSARHRNGEACLRQISVSAVRNPQGEPTHYVTVFSDVTALKESQQRLEQLAHYDPLTRLPNRTLLHSRLDRLLASARAEGSMAVVGYLDLDGFKPINDKHGHHVGDRLLVQIADRLAAAVRDGDTVARLGGDEFILLLTGLASAEDVEQLLARILRAVAEPVHVGELTLHVSASLGATIFPDDDSPPDILLRHADQAMYRAKQLGRSTYHLFDAAQDQLAQANQALYKRIAAALEEQELCLHYQPKVGLRDGRVVGVEALIRWQHPVEGLLGPAHFLPTSEGTELSEAIDRWVVESALAQMAAWQVQGLEMAVSVNVSARTLQQPELPDWLGECLARHPQLAASGLTLEVLESAALADIGIVSANIARCAAHGVGFALDDFGTGYSSLTYLRRLPAKVLKIDRSFVAGMLGNPEDLAIVEGVLGLAGAFDRSVIAEGVETPAQGRALLALGCDTVQGFGIARPMPAAAVPAWVAGFALGPEWRPGWRGTTAAEAELRR
ncbi:EAL domain-containing protein [Azoarcus indigens]|uniref:PAS domain S-box-containing protein/diguanylate cyclase (GGDEF)-like protein n=1 Tax=Azoarcus indigens TaxID=29545 RepID=A0A4R6DP72_9RHOO|nr:EAL domain-containing protein [Azoarcus indigens]NMG67254.1 EAL domain-containing protein [Azoarcus indigens]TDN46805.1 PAS domain S-box-containing protein/diguanylate cyclase (GGDEF)-like protein [Azoarcus indigens]